MEKLIKTWNDLGKVNQKIQDLEIAIDNISRWPNKTSEDYAENATIVKQLADAKDEKVCLLNQLIEDAEEEKVKVCDTIPDEEPNNFVVFNEWERHEILERVSFYDAAYRITSQDKDGNNYEAVGHYSCDELQEIEDVEKIKPNISPVIRNVFVGGKTSAPDEE